MSFQVITGRFRVATKTALGNPKGLQPDKVSRLDNLEQVGHPYRLSGIGSVNLRFEGIDTPELHYHGSRQKAPEAEAARDDLLAAIGMKNVQFSQPAGVTVKPPVHDGQVGFICAKQLESNGRPVSWVFTGKPPVRDGEQVRVTVALLKRSLNYRLLSRGFAYPLFYDSLYADLRAALTAAAQAAAGTPAGVWNHAPTRLQTIRGTADIEGRALLFPKLFRRLVDFYAAGQTDLIQLGAWMDAKNDNDEVWKLPGWNRTHFDNVLKISGNRIALAQSPEDLVFVSK